MRHLFAIVERNTPGGDLRFFSCTRSSISISDLEKPVSLSITKAKPHLPYASFFCVPASGGHISCPVLPSLCTSVHAMPIYTITIQYLGYTATSLYFNINVAQLFRCIFPKWRNLRVLTRINYLLKVRKFIYMSLVWLLTFHIKVGILIDYIYLLNTVSNKMYGYRIDGLWGCRFPNIFDIITSMELYRHEAVGLRQLSPLSPPSHPCWIDLRYDQRNGDC